MLHCAHIHTTRFNQDGFLSSNGISGGKKQGVTTVFAFTCAKDAKQVNKALDMLLEEVGNPEAAEGMDKAEIVQAKLKIKKVSATPGADGIKLFQNAQRLNGCSLKPTLGTSDTAQKLQGEWTTEIDTKFKSFFSQLV